MSEEEMIIKCGKCGRHKMRLTDRDGIPLNAVYCGDCHAITIGEDLTVCRDGKCSQGKSLLEKR